MIWFKHNRFKTSLWCRMPLALLVLLPLLASCNLFIDDDYTDENGFKNVPVHEGNGYDAPVTVNDNGCEVTYQYNSDVRVLDDTEQRYIVKAQMDPAGAFMEIHFSKNTPDDLLPVPGEVLLSTVTGKFPWGCNHRVQYRVDEDGVYKYIAFTAMLEETFKELKITGNLTSKEEEDYYVSAVPYDEMMQKIESENEPADQPASARTRGGADDELSFTIDKVHVKLSGETTELTVPFSYAPKGMDFPKGFHGEIRIPEDKNFYRMVNVLNFQDFDLAKGNLIAKVTQTVEEQNYVEITGGWDKSWTIHRWRPVTGKAFVVGPVVLVFFINLDLKADIDLALTATFSRHKKTENIYNIDLYKKTITKNSRVIEDTGWKYTELYGSVTFALIFEAQFGLGIYGKVVSVRVVPVFTLKFTVNNPKKIKLAGGDKDVVDIQERPGPTFSFTIDLKLGVYLDLSLKNIINSWKQAGSAEDKKLLEQIKADAQKSSDYYQALVDEDNELYDPNRKDKQEGDKSEGDDEVDANVTFNIVNLSTSWSWYPTIDDNSLFLDKHWDNEKQKMIFTGRYTVDQEGVLQTLFANRYIPGLCVRKDSKVVGFLFSREAGQTGRARSGTTYHFDVDDTDDDQEYSIAPCYFLLEDESMPVAIDKLKNVNITSPHTVLFSVAPVRSYREYLSPKVPGDKTWKYHFLFYTDVKAQGVKYMDKFGVKDIMFNSQHDYNKRGDVTMQDGIYRLNWNATKKSNVSDYGVEIGLVLQSFFVVEGKEVVNPNMISFTMSTDGTYIINDGDLEESGTYSSRRFFYEDDEPVEVELESVEYRGI